MPDAALPALSLIATPGKRQAILDLAVEAEARGFAGIACPSLGSAISLSVSLAHVTSSRRACCLCAVVSPGRCRRFWHLPTIRSPRVGGGLGGTTVGMVGLSGERRAHDCPGARSEAL